MASAMTVAARHAYSIAANRLRRPLGLFRSWLTRHDAVILTAVFAAVGLLAVCQGVAALATG